MQHAYGAARGAILLPSLGDPSRAELKRTLFLAMESGNHVKDAAVRCYKVRRVRLNSGGNGHLQLSGQEIPNKSATEIEVLRGVASMRY